MMMVMMMMMTVNAIGPIRIVFQ